jgi:hypothetical protein
MPTFRESQRIGKSITGVAQQVTLKYNTDHWELNKWDGDGFVTLADQTTFVPEFSIRTMRVVGTVGQSAVVKFSLAGYSDSVVSESIVATYETGIIDTFATLQEYIRRVTMVYLGSPSTFTELALGS